MDVYDGVRTGCAIDMLILTDLNDVGRPVMEHGAAKLLSQANDFYDDPPVKAAENYLLTVMRGMTAAEPGRKLAIVRVTYQILHRNHEPVNPCGA